MTGGILDVLRGSFLSLTKSIGEKTGFASDQTLYHYILATGYVKTMNEKSLKITLLEPFYGGSHRAVALGWQAHSRHDIGIIGLDARFWKWRMRSAAFEFAKRVRDNDEKPDLFFVGSMMDVAHFRALTGDMSTPVITFFHEAQASYPWPGGETPERDYQYLVTDIASAAASDRVAFNSHTLRRDYLAGCREFISRMPDHRPLWLLDEIEKKSTVLTLGVEFGDIDRLPEREGADGGEPVILWCHRWEYDKNPEGFFRVMRSLKEKGLGFKLIVAGTRTDKWPGVFDSIREDLAERIIHWGGVGDRGKYLELLGKSDYVVSTANHETFGLGMVEAAYAGAHPLAPNRLSYPEVFPPAIHANCLYDDEAGDGGGVEAKLTRLLTGEEERLGARKLKEAFAKFDWRVKADDFDQVAASVL